MTRAIRRNGNSPYLTTLTISKSQGEAAHFGKRGRIVGKVFLRTNETNGVVANGHGFRGAVGRYISVILRKAVQ